ncbi:membrane lipoprotein [Halorhabdus tiamatea SARL4B]|uniref:Extracellular solute-binding protein, family 5 n=1 Tax=Halorhabdus tiamatea SARL4B TaxID=1033806 RepID=F7PKM7_9EURY|nr:hypothetical protein [Halorhabdus tiamatea]ERJ05954.1 membrane lipoprotein [Halorhabdus tiamatea SARL4B]CCQ34012.1 extracellular solute-binding protein, family 5 [Halorhabdus tiamatea SARL4B]
MRRPKNPLDELSRRQYVQAIVAASVAGAAGCTGDGDDTTEPSGNGDENGTGNGDENGTGNGTENGGGQQPVTDEFTVVDNNVPEQADMSTWQTGDRSTGKNWMTELSSARTQGLNIIIDGHTYSMPHVDGVEEVSIPAFITDYTAEPPYDMYNTYNQDMYYWDEETPIDAEARVEHDYVYYGYDGLIFNADESFKSEAVEQYRHHFWYEDGTRRLTPRNSNAPSGESELPDNGTNAYVMETDTVEGIAQTEAMPEHPGYTTPYAERYADAANTDETTTITDDLNGDRISMPRLANEGWGGGPYKLESGDDVSGTDALLHLRDNHPNNHIDVPKLRIRFATEDRAQVMRARGLVDLENGVLPMDTGNVNRNAVPDYTQEIARWLQIGGDNLIFNFNNKHLGRLWVRRAAVAAIDWNQVGANGWGPEVSEANPHHIGVLESVAEGNFSQDFLDQMYTYPIEADQELAAEWMRKAGYEKQGGSWVGPDGDSPDWDLTFNSGEAAWIGGVQTVMANLEDFGLGVTLDGNAWDTYTSRLEPPDYDYDIGLQWANFQTITGAYNDNGAWWSNPMLSGSPNTSPYFELGDDDEVDGLGRPVENVPLPSEVGSIEAPEGAYKVPDSIPGGAETYDMLDVTEGLREPGVSIDQVRERARVPARYFNYYLPNFVFHSYYNGVYGNVKDFNFPPADHEIWGSTKEYGSRNYSVIAGMPQLKYDESYPDPPADHRS